MRIYLIAAPLLALLLVPIAVTQLRPAAPEELAYRTLVALERRDALALYDLGSPSERGQAGITRAGIAAYLDRTLYREGDPGRLRIVKVNMVRPNCVQYLVETGRTRSNGQPRTIILTVQQQEGQPFHVALGELLWNAIPASYSRPEPAHVTRAYVDLSKQTGIRGWYTVVDGWTLLANGRFTRSD